LAGIRLILAVLRTAGNMRRVATALEGSRHRAARTTANLPLPMPRPHQSQMQTSLWDAANQPLKQPPPGLCDDAVDADVVFLFG
jgi:hypothetical protein